MKQVAIIMAGGKGERLWPRSRDNYPKQFLEFIPNKGSLLQQTIDRISKLVDIKDIFVTTNILYKNIVIKQLPKLPRNNIICEPLAKNTSPTIELASLIIKKRYKKDDVITFVLPSDSYISNNNKFVANLKQASKFAEKGYLVTIGIKPTRPDTNYGYIKYNSSNSDIIKFEEKPTENKAKKYLKNNYYWNTGIFIWKISTILNEFNKYIPKQHNLFNSFKTSKIDDYSTIKSIYDKLESISIDYAVMEKSTHSKMVEGEFVWDDLGSWLSLSRINKLDKYNNYKDGNVISIDSKNNIISSKDKLIATLGINNLIIIESFDSILITSKEKLNDVKNIRAKLSNNKKYL